MRISPPAKPSPVLGLGAPPPPHHVQVCVCVPSRMGLPTVGPVSALRPPGVHGAMSEPLSLLLS